MLLALALLGCTPAADRPFPEGFRWGSATAGFQVEAGCPTWPAEDCEDRASDWYAWVTAPEITGNPDLHVTGEPLAAAPGMWETFEDDVRQMKRDHHSAFRMSLEWSRLFPGAAAAEATTVEELAAHVDTEAAARYRAQLQALRRAGIEPVVTVNHYTLPLWVHEPVACHADLDACPANGWIDGERIVPLIALYAGFVAHEYGDLVDTWATLNEPFATTLSGYLLPGEDRSAPPGVRMNGPAVVASLQHQIEGHAAMVDAIRQHDTADADGDDVAAQAGLVLNFTAITPADSSDPDDVEAAARCDYLYHRVFLDAITAGSWDDDLDGTPDRTRTELADRLDWLGINYYNQLLVTGTSITILPEVPASRFIPSFSWDPYPEGIAQVVGVAGEYGRPIWISENGTPHVDRADAILSAHLGHLADAIDAGADVRGYLYWSWVDNYEWNHGMDMRFGLYQLEADKSRTPRPAAAVLAESARRNGWVEGD